MGSAYRPAEIFNMESGKKILMDWNYGSSGPRMFDITDMIGDNEVVLYLSDAIILSNSDAVFIHDGAVYDSIASYFGGRNIKQFLSLSDFPHTLILLDSGELLTVLGNGAIVIDVPIVDRLEISLHGASFPLIVTQDNQVYGLDTPVYSGTEVVGLPAKHLFDLAPGEELIDLWAYAQDATVGYEEVLTFTTSFGRSSQAIRAGGLPPIEIGEFSSEIADLLPSTPTPQVRKIFFGDTEVTDFEVLDNNTILATVPANGIGVYGVSIQSIQSDQVIMMSLTYEYTNGNESETGLTAPNTGRR